MSDIHDHVHAFADGELEPAEAEAFRDHLGICEQCQAELEDILQLQVLGSQLAEQGASLPSRRMEPAAPPPRAFRPAWSRRRVGLAVALGGSLAAAVVLAVLYGPGRDVPGTVSSEALALAPTRSMEARLSYEGAAGYRPYGVMRSGTESPRETVPLKTLTRMEEAGDFHGLAVGALLGGASDQAAAYFQQAGGSPDVECDRAVLAFSKGSSAQALTILDGVLEKTPKHPQALWNRGLVLRELGLESLAVDSFRQVAALGEPGWSEEARERADGIERQVRERRSRWEAAGRAGRALVEQGTLLPEGTVRDAPSLVRGYLYLAAWTAPTAERVRALLPVARELDALQGNGVLQKYVEDTARRDFRKRGPLAATFAKVLAGQLAPFEAEAWFQQLQATGQRDMLLGALPLMTQLPTRLGEYEVAAREVGDPWFLVNAELHRARGQHAAGQLAEAEATLLAALPACEQSRLDSRCAELEALLSRVYLSEQKPAEARERAQHGLNRARAMGDASLEVQFLQLLADSARLENSLSLERAYVAEVGLRQSQTSAHAALPPGL